LQKGVEFDYINIDESIKNLKMFLNVRDKFDVFDKIREENRVGLPCIVVNEGEKIVFDPKELDL
jgi:glutaredoxin-related protein